MTNASRSATADWRMLRRSTFVLIMVSVTLMSTGCGSSSKSPSGVASPSTAGTAPGPTISPNESCPFSGSTASQSEPGVAGTTTLTAITSTPAGCIDNVTFAFSPSLASSVTGYQTPPPSGGGAVLVVTLQGTTLAGGLKAGTTHPTNMNYVSQVQTSSTSGDVVFRVTLDRERPFLVSGIKVGPQLTLAVG